MQAVILVGGLGTRLRPITYDVPKALVPLRNRPFMGYMLDFLKSGGLEGAVLSLGYLPTPIQEYLAGCDLEGFSVYPLAVPPALFALPLVPLSALFRGSGLLYPRCPRTAAASPTRSFEGLAEPPRFSLWSRVRLSL